MSYSTRKRDYNLISLLTALFLIAFVTFYFSSPLPQDPAYHDFADQRTLLFVPHFFNVISNLPFVLIGIIGLFFCKKSNTYFLHSENRLGFIVLFLGVLLTGIGSAYYHTNPNNWGLFWDRLAMAISFMGFFSILLGEFVGNRLSRKLLLPLLLYGVGSVIYWIVTEQSGNGDLRPYILTQFLPLICIPISLFIRRKTGTFTTFDLSLIATGYVLAKCFEIGDYPLFTSLAISGHTLKHLAAAFSAGWMIVIITRKPCTTG